MLSCLVVSYTQRPSGFKAITKSCKNASKNEIYLQEIYQSSNQEMFDFTISLSSCSRYNANFKLDQSVSAIHDSPPYF